MNITKIFGLNKTALLLSRVVRCGRLEEYYRNKYKNTLEKYYRVVLISVPIEISIRVPVNFWIRHRYKFDGFSWVYKSKDYNNNYKPIKIG